MANIFACLCYVLEVSLDALAALSHFGICSAEKSQTKLVADDARVYQRETN